MTPTDMRAALLAGCDRAEQMDAEATEPGWDVEDEVDVYNATRSYLVAPCGNSRCPDDLDAANAALIAAARNAWPVIVQGWRTTLDEHRPSSQRENAWCEGSHDLEVWIVCPVARAVAAAQHAAGLLPAEVQTALREAGMLP